MEWTSLFTEILVPAVTAVVGFFGGRWQRKSSDIKAMQDTIELLQKTNHEYMDKILKMQDEILQMNKKIADLELELAKYKSDGNKNENQHYIVGDTRCTSVSDSGALGSVTPAEAGNQEGQGCDNGVGKARGRKADRSN